MVVTEIRKGRIDTLVRERELGALRRDPNCPAEGFQVSSFKFQVGGSDAAQLKTWNLKPETDFRPAQRRAP